MRSAICLSVARASQATFCMRERTLRRLRRGQVAAAADVLDHRADEGRVRFLARGGDVARHRAAALLAPRGVRSLHRLARDDERRLRLVADAMPEDSGRPRLGRARTGDHVGVDRHRAGAVPAKDVVATGGAADLDAVLRHPVESQGEHLLVERELVELALQVEPRERRGLAEEGKR